MVPLTCGEYHCQQHVSSEAGIIASQPRRGRSMLISLPPTLDRVMNTERGAVLAPCSCQPRGSPLVYFQISASLRITLLFQVAPKGLYVSDLDLRSDLDTVDSNNNDPLLNTYSVPGISHNYLIECLSSCDIYYLTFINEKNDSQMGKWQVNFL